MYINQAGEIKVRVRGVDSAIRSLTKHSIEDKIAAQKGVHKAAEYLMGKIKEKFGTYQSTGGTNGGPWAKLQFNTNKRKLRKYGFMNKPLIATGHMKDSFYVKDATNNNAIAASVASTDPKLIHHIYGAPRANVPPRDPMLVTAIEQESKCHNIIIDQIYRAYDNEE